MSAFGFDNVADAQGSSPALLQAYLAAARKISAVAVGDPRIATGSDTYAVRQDLSQDVHLEGLPLGTVGGMRARHTFPVDGEYEFQVRLYRTNLSAIRGLEDPQELELTLDGEPILRAAIGGEKDLIGLQTNPTDTSDALEASRLRVRRVVKAGQRDVAAAFLDEDAAALRDQSPAALHPRFLEPLRCRRRAARPVDHHSRSVRREDRRGAAEPARVHLSPAACGFRRGTPKTRCARRILSTLATQAYRRPLSDAEVDDLLNYYTQAKARRHVPGRHSVRAAPHPRQPVVRVPSGGRAGVDRRRARRIASPTSSWRRGSRSSSGAACPTRRCCAPRATGV